jgi:predicted ABC-type ATPase
MAMMIMLAGPNGAGKSTIYEHIVRSKFNAPFINADKIQKEELSDQSMQGAYQAAKVAEQRRQEYLKSKLSFVSESTFSHPSKLQLIDEAIQADFRVVVYHVNVRTPELSVARVAMRVKQGGHDVPEEKIRGRYSRNQTLIKKAALNADVGFVYDNSRLNKLPQLCLVFRHGKLVLKEEDLPVWVQSLYGRYI